MNSVVSALVQALKSLFHPKMLSLVLWPMLVAVVLWVGAAMIYWGSWVEGMTGMVQATPLQQWMEQGVFAVVSHYLITIILVLLLLPAISRMASRAARQSYPELELRRGGSTAGSVVNAVVATVVYCAGWVLSLP